MKTEFPIVHLPISKLKPSEYNPRSLSTKQFNDLKKSFKSLGTLEPAVINQFKGRENIIISGHQRLKVAAALGMTVYPCHEVKFPLKKEREANIRMNRNTGAWDFDILANEFEVNDLIDFGFDPSEIGVDIDVGTEGLTDADAIPEAPKEAKTKTGDIYLLGAHRLLCGDATKISDTEKLMDGHLADLIVTDPPYNVGYTGKTEKKLTIQNDQMDDGLFAEFLKKAYHSYFTAIKQGGGDLCLSLRSGVYKLSASIKDVWFFDQAVLHLGQK